MSGFFSLILKKIWSCSILTWVLIYKTHEPSSNMLILVTYQTSNELLCVIKSQGYEEYEDKGSWLTNQFSLFFESGGTHLPCFIGFYNFIHQKLSDYSSDQCIKLCNHHNSCSSILKSFTIHLNHSVLYTLSLRYVKDNLIKRSIKW